MNQLRKHTNAVTLALLVSVLFLTNCAKETEKVAPQTTENGQNVAAPVSKAAPLSKVEKESLSMQYFPKNARKSARTQSAGVTDYVDFNDQMALTILPGYASNTFAYAPFYIQQVGTAWIHVKENNSTNYNAGFRSNYGHYHLGYQNFVPCLTSGGQFGKPSGSSCLSINPVLEPRTLSTHYGDEWIKIYAYDYTHDSRVFDLLGIRVTGGPIQLWFKKQGGGWWHWSSLGNVNWNTSAYSTDITEVLISGTGSASISFDDVRVNVPY